MREYILPIILAICIGVILITSSFLYVTYQNLQVAKQQIDKQNQIIDTQKQTLESQQETIENQRSEIQTHQETIQQQEENINNLESEVQQQKQEINELESKVTSLQTQVESLTYALTQKTGELEKTASELSETTRLLNIAKKYEERVREGIDSSEAYKLLGDYDKTVGIVANITSVSRPRDDQELWSRARDIYNWLGNNYGYCPDRIFCIGGDYCAEIQYFSPDELLYYGSQGVLCGDCDDQAHLFAGMMYASGVTHDRVRVECGLVGEVAGHCWNGIYLNNRWYRIDPVCSDPAEYIEFFGIKIKISGREFPTTYQNVDCFSNYTLYHWYTPEGYNRIR